MAIYKNGVLVPTYTDAEAVAAAKAGAKIGDFLADTLANLNAKVSDATLDTSSAARTPSAHESTHVSGGSDDIDSALAAAAIPSLATSKITSTRFPVDRLPALTDEKIWKGTGGNVEEIDVPAAGATLTIAETEVFNGSPPTSMTDLDLSGTIGANAAVVVLKLSLSVSRAFAVRKNGDTDDFYDQTTLECGGAAAGSTDIVGNIHTVLIVATDNSGVIEWQTEANSVTATIDIIAYIK